MSGLLHPVGPEEPRVYWIRRIGVLAAVGLLVVILMWVFGDPPAEEPTAAGPSPEATTEPSVDPSVAPSASAEPTASASASSEPTASASAGAEPTASAQPPASTTATASPTPTPTPVCDPADLRVTLTAKRVVAAKQRTTFDLSVINGHDKPCTVSLTAENFELKIYSGTDRIWSTKDCDKWIKPVSGTLKPEGAVKWQLSWPGQRSSKNCTLRSETLRPGTYVATVQITGAKPVQHVMNLR